MKSRQIGKIVTIGLFRWHSHGLRYRHLQLVEQFAVAVVILLQTVENGLCIAHGALLNGLAPSTGWDRAGSGFQRVANLGAWKKPAPHGSGQAKLIDGKNWRALQDSNLRPQD